MSVFSKDNQPLSEKEALARHIETALAVEPPSGVELELSYQLIKRLFRPMVLGNSADFLYLHATVLL